MKKFIIIAILITSFIVLYFLKFKNSSNIIDNQSVEIYNYPEWGITIAKVPSFEFLYDWDDPISVKSFAEENKYKYIINGSFFGGSRDNATHAGYLNIDGTIMSELKNKPDKDSTQLTHILSYDYSTLEMYNLDEYKYEENTSSIIEFQTGPIVIENNRVQSDFIDNSINGKGKYKRTLLAYVNDEIFFVTVRDSFNLNELGEILLGLDIFQNKNLNVINLDGGPSVALYSKENPELNFNIDAVLPILLGVK